jgi:hypothetical protein
VLDVSLTTISHDSHQIVSTYPDHCPTFPVRQPYLSQTSSSSQHFFRPNLLTKSPERQRKEKEKKKKKRKKEEKEKKEKKARDRLIVRSKLDPWRY